MNEYTLFYITFALQVAILSIYFPVKIMAKIRSMLEAHPPEQYPKLYPLSEDTYVKSQRRFEVFNILVVVLGLAVILWIEFYSKRSVGNILDEISIFFFLVQLVPMALLELSEKSNYKIMRAINKTKKKVAALKPRSIFDFASKSLFAFTLGLMLASFIIDFILNGTSGWEEALQRTITIIITNLLLFILMWCNVYSKKLNPHQDDADRLNHISIAVKSLLYISMGMSVYLIVKQVTKQDNLDFIQPALSSLYCLAIGVMCIGTRINSFNANNENFEVYR